MAEEKVEAPERIWLLQAVLDCLGVKGLIVPLSLRNEAVEYVRADITRQRAERAAEEVCKYHVGSNLQPAYKQTIADIIATEFEK